MLTVVIFSLSFNLIELNSIFMFNTPPAGDKFLTFLFQ